MGVPPFYEIFFITYLVLKDRKKILCKCYQNYLTHIRLNFFYFSDELEVVSMAPHRGLFPWHPMRGIPPLNES